MARPITFDPEAALDQSLEVFWTRGYHDTSVEDIVRASGLNRHSLYARFGSKLGLLRAAIERYRQRVEERIDVALAVGITSRDKVDALFALREPGAEDELFGPMLARGCLLDRIAQELKHTHPEFREVYQQLIRLIETKLVEVLRAGQRRGELSDERQPESLAAVLLAGFMLPLIYQPAGPCTEPFLSLVG